MALVGASIAGFASIYSAADHKVPAIVVVRPVAQGQLLTSADLGEAEVSVSDGVGYVPVDEANLVSGKRASAAIPSGSLLTMGDLTGAPAIAAGDAVVGIALKDGFYPASGVSPGDQVMVVQTAAPGSVVAVPPTGSASPTSTTPLTTGSDVTISGTSATGTATDSVVLVQQADIFAVAAPTESSGTYSLLVSIEVSESVAAEVTTAATAGQVGIVLLPQGGGTPSSTPAASAATTGSPAAADSPSATGSTSTSGTGTAQVAG